jgi:CMP-N,N'-diacetyllegionaminic acid synthase
MCGGKLNVAGTVALIPARGGSKGIPRKNLQLLAGRPLLSYSIEHARCSQLIERVIVSTDDEEIAAVSEAYGAEVIRRPADISDDLSTSEAALHHALDFLRASEGYVAELVVFLQATSPLRSHEAIDEAVTTLIAEGADSLFSACAQHSFLWKREGRDMSTVNYDYRHRHMRQKGPEYFAENGSIYVFRPWVLQQTGARLGGKIAIYPMDYLHSIQIDNPVELELAAQLLTICKQETPRPLAEISYGRFETNTTRPLK